MGFCQRIKYNRVFYDQRSTIEVLNEVNVSLANLIAAGIDITTVNVEASIIECDVDVANQTATIEFFIKKTLTFVDDSVIEFSFNPTATGISLPKLGETTIPDEFLDRLQCQIFDFTPIETFTYSPASQLFNDQLSIDLTLKVSAEDQALFTLCPPNLTRTVTVTP